MRRYIELFKVDARHLIRDPMMGFGILAPLILSLALRYGLPVIDTVLEREFQLRLLDYHALILSVALLLVPLMLGMLSGFMMLDERDESLIAYYAITPLSKKGYFLYRLTLPALLTGVYTVYLLPASGLPVPSVLTCVPVALMLTLEAPLIGLFLAAAAANKIEGLALSKAAGLLVLAPLAAYYLPGSWQLVAAWMPTYWPAKLLVMDTEPASAAFWMAALGGLGWHAVLLHFLYKRFTARAE